jgi:hypothetical protein
MIWRYFRAFVVALRMTLRGETFTPQYPELTTWVEETTRLVDAVYQAADGNGLRKPERDSFILHLDKRDISMETILATVRHHSTQEYTRLMRDKTRHTFVAIHASNLNDRFRVAELGEKVESLPVKAAIMALSHHLEAIPSNTSNVKNL